MKITPLLIDNAKKYSHKSALIFQNEPISFLQLKDNAFKLAQALLKLGLKKSDKIAIYLPNCPQYFYSYLAIWSCGFVAVPLDFMLTEEEIVSCLRHSEAKAIIMQPKPNVRIENIKLNCLQLKEIIVTKEKISGTLSLIELIQKQSSIPPCVEINPQDLAAIFYTSGSTGRPKGVLTNYLQIEAPAKAMSYFVNLNDNDIALCALPLSHLGGLVFLQGLVYLGSSVVLMERFIPLEFLRNIQEYKVTCFWLVPQMYYAILQLKEFETFDFSSLRFITVFGAPGSFEQIKRFHKYCPNAKLFHGWGMTETQGPTIVSGPDSKKIESIGRPLPWVEVKIFDEDDKELPTGQVGEIVIRGEQISVGYYKDPQLTQQTIRNGWFHTGDLGRFDEEGDLYIVGRIKEMIKVAGQICFEPEVETVIMKHPEVIECAVVGVPDKLRGEVPKAFVVLKEGSKLGFEDLREFCRKHLAHFKIPHYFEFLKELPKTRSGKVDKTKLRNLK
ncbi:MAG: acyl--CoA ligase [Candidatus Omnitrophica bacterium]|nr:acyl--CoA ligase [Candidatus Omnitrophota bacterium]